MAQYCEIGECPNKSTRYRKNQNVCEIHYSEQEGLTNPRVKPEQVRKCENCGYKSLNKNGTKERLIEHHITYKPEKTILVCDKCHQEIHNNSNHQYNPSEKQIWNADKPIRKQDVKKLPKVGKVTLSYQKSSKEKTGEFVQDHGLLGFKEEQSSQPVWNCRKYINRFDVKFLDKKPWEIEEEVGNQ